MLCSRCSEPITPVVAIDIDGTLGDYYSHISSFAEDYLNCSANGVPEYHGGEPHREWFCRTFGVDATKFREVKLAYRQGGLKRTMPVYPGASELTHSLRAAGAEVWLTTSRPWERYDRIDPDTREWVRRNDIEFDGLIYDEDKMVQLSRHVEKERVICVLDDLKEVLLEAAHIWGLDVALLRRTTNNRDVEWTASIYSLTDALPAIAPRIAKWNVKQGLGD